MSKIKRMSTKEFREQGYLRELNRQFLHPLGMALEVYIDDEAGTATFGEVWDYRDDPEGMLFDDKSMQEKEAVEQSERIAAEAKEKAEVRQKKFGYAIQPCSKQPD